MSLESALTIAIAIFVFGLTPGPGVFAIVARALALGFRPTLIFILGIITGDLVYLVLAALGLSVIASQYAAAFALLKIAGGLYLVYLGVQTWRSAKNADTGLAPVAEGGRARGYLSGFSVTMGNPKVVVFYVAFLPAFVDLGTLTMPDLIAVAVVVTASLLASLLVYAAMAARARIFFKSVRAVRNLRRGAGALMVGAGGAVAAS
jgi:threonine/homoserine/homoserine lactone efflux protein